VMDGRAVGLKQNSNCRRPGNPKKKRWADFPRDGGSDTHRSALTAGQQIKGSLKELASFSAEAWLPGYCFRARSYPGPGAKHTRHFMANLGAAVYSFGIYRRTTPATRKSRLPPKNSVHPEKIKGFWPVIPVFFARHHYRPQNHSEWDPREAPWRAALRGQWFQLLFREVE